MFLTAKKAVFAGMLLAISIVLMLLGHVIEASTLFFLAAAACCIGIVIRELGIKIGAAFLAASILLGLFLAPNKLYVWTYGTMEGYLFLRELWWVYLKKRKPETEPSRWTYLLGKFVAAQLLLLPIILLAPSTFYVSDSAWTARFLLGVAGELLWILGDIAYDVFQRQIWGRFRRHLDWIL